MSDVTEVNFFLVITVAQIIISTMSKHTLLYCFFYFYKQYTLLDMIYLVLYREPKLLLYALNNN